MGLEGRRWHADRLQNLVLKRIAVFNTFICDTLLSNDLGGSPNKVHLVRNIGRETQILFLGVKLAY
jgi:hypothetical protein